MIILNKCDLADEAHLRRVEGHIRSLNAEATILRSSFGKVPLNAMLNTNRFDMAKSQASAKWIKELNNEHTPETEEYGVSSFVFEARRPFHPERLYNFIVGGFLKAVRSKGFVWLANRSDVAGLWSQAGGSFRLEPAGVWWATRPKEHARVIPKRRLGSTSPGGSPLAIASAARAHRRGLRQAVSTPPARIVPAHG